LRNSRTGLDTPDASEINEVPQGDLHLEALAMANASGKKYTFCREQLMTSRPERYGLVNRRSAGDPSAAIADTLVVHSREISNAIKNTMARNPGMNYDEAKTHARQDNPGLFRFEEHAADLSTEAALRIQCNEAIEKFRITNRCSYETARNRIRILHPDLFGISEEVAA
jgi:hypothetical protein